jgi:catechol 2,3-dioxygenase-like lactoylglutathione lyase family enzyme
MGFHHVAVAAGDIDAIHRFYTEALGFDLVKAVVAPTPTERPGGWARHLFYDTGNGQLIAFWDLHDPLLPADFEPGLSTAMGLPNWVNHLAFAADSLDDLATKRERLLDNGHDVAEIDHGWCTSIYANDPNGTLVEFCVTTKAFTSADRDQAAAALADPNPPLEDPPMPTFYDGRRAALAPTPPS